MPLHWISLKHTHRYQSFLCSAHSRAKKMKVGTVQVPSPTTHARTSIKLYTDETFVHDLLVTKRLSRDGDAEGTTPSLGEVAVRPCLPSPVLTRRLFVPFMCLTQLLLISCSCTWTLKHDRTVYDAYNVNTFSSSDTCVCDTYREPQQKRKSAEADPHTR